MNRVRPSDIMRLLKKQGFRCAYTGRELTPDNVSADHFIPVKDGGTHDIENIRLVCQEVNQAKGTLSFEAFVALCRDVVNHVDSQGAPIKDLIEYVA